MADLDTLQIQISASTSQADDAISRLQKALASLNASLSNYSDASNYVKGLANLTTGLNGMASAVDRIDTAKIKNIASAIGSLATNGGKLSNLNVAKALSTMGSAAQESSARTKKAVEDIVSSFNITDKEGVSKLTTAVEQFYSVIDDPVAVKSAEDDIRRLINDYSNFGKVVDENWQAVRDWVSNNKMLLGQGTVAELGDDFKRLRGELGIKTTTTTLGNSIDLETFVEEMNQALGLSRDWGNTVQDIAKNLAEFLSRGGDMSQQLAREEETSTLHTEKLADALDRLYASMGRVREMEAEPEFYGVGDGLDYDPDLPFADDTVPQMDAVTASSREMKSSIDSASVSVEKIEEELKQEIGNPFAGIVEGITSLEGFEITADQFSGVKVLAESLGKFADKNAPIAAQNIPAIAQGLQMFSDVNIPAGLASQLAELGPAVGTLGLKHATNAQGLIKVAEGITALSAATTNMPNLDALRSLSNAVGAFGRKGAGNAIANLPLLAEGFRNLIVTLSNTPNISRNVIDLANAMAQVASSGANVGKASVSGANGIRLMGRSAKSARKHFTSLAATFGRLYANFFLIIRAVRLFKKAIDVSSDLREVQNVVATTFGSATDKVQEFSDQAILSFGMSELSAKKFASRFQAMGVAMNVTSEQVAKASDFLSKKLEGNARAYDNLGNSMADVSINLTKLTADMASFYNADYEAVAEDMAAVLTGMTRPLRKYGLDLTEATLKEWALANGLDGDIKKMTQAEKTMLRYQYVMANMGHVMGDFTKTADTWANVTRTIGQQFQKLGQIIGTGFINAFKPALIAFRGFMNTLIDLTEKALNALGKLMGWQVEIEDVGVTLDDDMEDYADSIDDAAGSAKKLLKMLLPIDELNVLSDSGNGGGGDATGGGGGLSDAVTGGGLTFKPYESDIDSWYEFGKRISEKIKEALEDINWDGIFKKAQDFGKNLAEFLNGGINPDTFYQFGRTLANALNTVIESAWAFALNFDFENFGESLAAQVNGFFENFDFAGLAKSINVWVDGIWTVITSAVKNINWKAVFSGLLDFFSNLDLETTAFVALANLPRLMKSAFGARVIANVTKAYKAMDLFTSTTVASRSALAGIVTVFPKLGSKINKVENAVVQYNLGLKEGFSKTESFNGAVESLTWGLTPLAKGLLVAGAGVAEFALISDGVKDIATGVGSLVGNLAELATGAAVAGTAMTLVFGFPAGLIATGVIGLIGAFNGLKKSADELEDMRLADSMRGAFVTESGVPLDEYIETIRQKLLGFGDGFEMVSEKSSALNVATSNVSDLVFEIDKIKTEMDAGVLSVEEGSAILEQKFGELADAINVKLGAALDVVLAGFGEGGAISQAYNATGTEVDALKEATVQSYSDIEKQTAQLVAVLEDMPYGTDSWYAVYEKLMALTSGMSETEKAAEDLKTQIATNGLDWSAYFDENNGTVYVDGITKAISDLSDTASGVGDTFKEEVNNMIVAMQNLGDTEGAEALRNGLPGALNYMNEQSATEIKKATDTIQTDLIDNINTIITDAQSDWEEMHWWEKLIKFGGDEDYFIKERLNEYKTNIVDPISNQIETSMEDLGLEGAGWASSATESILNGIFDYDALSNTHLSDNWKKVVDEVHNTVDGGDITRGLLEGMTQVPGTEYLNASRLVEKETEDALATAYDSHSPARKMYPIGENIVLGIFEGFKNVDYSAKMNEWWNTEVKPWFSSDRWGEIGQTAMDGLLPKIEEMNGLITSSFQTTWDGIQGIVSSSIDVLKGMMNFSWSLPHIDVPHFEMSGGFDLEHGKVPNIDVKYYAQGGYPSVGSLFVAGEAGAEMVGSIGGKTGVASNGEITGIASAIYETASQTNALLRGVISAIDNKETGITDEAIFSSVRSSAKAFRNRTNSDAFA